MARAAHFPSLDHESRLWQQGTRHVAGVDEAGRGALAGPVVAAAVVLPPFTAYQGVWSQVRDSKQLRPAQRTALAEQIRDAALCWGIGAVAAAEIDAAGIAVATQRAMAQAIAALSPQPDYLLIDWVRLAQVNLPQESRARADADMVSVAAASILAKVQRDAWLTRLALAYPEYGFERHMGYGTAGHLAALQRWGPCAEHRRSFAPLARPWTLFDPPSPAGNAAEVCRTQKAVAHGR